MKISKSAEFVFEEQYCLATLALMLSDALRKSGLTKSEVARRLGVKPPRVSQLFNATGNPTIKTLVRVLQVLDLKLEVNFAKRSENVGSRKA